MTAARSKQAAAGSGANKQQSSNRASTTPSLPSAPSGSKLLGAHDVHDFLPFPGEPSLLGPAWQAAKRRRVYLMLLPLTVTIILLLLATLQQQPHQSVFGQLCADTRKMLGMSAAKAGICAAHASTWFPPTRDIYSVLVAIILSATPLVIWHQWKAYTTLLSDMHSQGALLISDDGSSLRTHVDEANKQIGKIGRLAPIIMILVATAISELMAAQQREGIFYALAPNSNNKRQWAQSAYNQWWASTTMGSAGHVLYFALATWGIYVITQQNIVGFYIIRALLRSRSNIQFGADASDADGYFGWATVRSALAATYIELAMHGIALACVAITMSPGSLVGPLAVASFQYMISLPVHLAFPFLFVRGNIKKYKSGELSRLEIKIRAIDQSLPEYERISIENTYSERMAKIRSVPTLPFKSIADTSIFLIGFVADTSAVAALIISFSHL